MSRCLLISLFKRILILCLCVSRAKAFVVVNPETKSCRGVPKNKKYYTRTSLNLSTTSANSTFTRSMPIQKEPTISSARCNNHALDRAFLTGADNCAEALASSTSNDQYHHNYAPMPWGESIEPGNPLTFMPYYVWTENMLSRLTNLRRLPTSSEYQYKEKSPPQHQQNRGSHGKKARIINESYQSDEYRKIRLTYYDAGDTQVFNSLWYPSPELGNLPLLGIDLIQFRNRYLVVVDFQPLYEGKESNSPQIEKLKQIHSEMPSVLRGRISKRFYDESLFFSQHMLFGRFSKQEANESGIVDVEGELHIAFQNYARLHMEMVQDKYLSYQSDYTAACSSSPVYENSKASEILLRHKAYDVYSAERDPAHAMFVNIFGEEFADGFVYDFLFSLSGGKQRGVRSINSNSIP